jgi:mono/diheme cytochrome c family protein
VIRVVGGWVVAVAAVAAAGAGAGCSKPQPTPGDEASLSFARDGSAVRTMTRSDLARVASPRVVTTLDPYYGKTKRFRAVPLRPVLESAFGKLDNEEREIVFRAKDGYTVPMRLERALEEGAHLALADEDAAGWEPIGPQRANPAPFYLFWSKAEQGSLETHPRPWQLASVELARFDAVFPHTSPGELPEGAPARVGYRVFREQCIRCHAVNREGGRVGPDLNVPQNILEYRPEAQVRAYVRNPATFRYGNMPAHPGLSEAELDGLVAYLGVMKGRKHDPDAKR